MQSLQDLEVAMNMDLQTVSAWAKQWLIGFNIPKTEGIIF
jgi:hypothetical protein